MINEYTKWILLVLLIVFAAIVWPTLYRQDILTWKDIQVIVKTNRLTGTSWVFIPSGWDKR